MLHVTTTAQTDLIQELPEKWRSLILDGTRSPYFEAHYASRSNMFQGVMNSLYLNPRWSKKMIFVTLSDPSFPISDWLYRKSEEHGNKLRTLRDSRVRLERSYNAAVKFTRENSSIGSPQDARQVVSTYRGAAIEVIYHDSHPRSLNRNLRIYDLLMGDAIQRGSVTVIKSVRSISLELDISIKTVHKGIEHLVGLGLVKVDRVGDRTAPSTYTIVNPQGFKTEPLPDDADDVVIPSNWDDASHDLFSFIEQGNAAGSTYAILRANKQGLDEHQLSAVCKVAVHSIRRRIAKLIRLGLVDVKNGLYFSISSPREVARKRIVRSYRAILTLRYERDRERWEQIEKVWARAGRLRWLRWIWKRSNKLGTDDFSIPEDYSHPDIEAYRIGSESPLTDHELAKLGGFSSYTEARAAQLDERSRKNAFQIPAKLAA